MAHLSLLEDPLLLLLEVLLLQSVLPDGLVQRVVRVKDPKALKQQLSAQALLPACCASLRR